MISAFLKQELLQAGFDQWVEQLEQVSPEWFIHHGDYPRWSAALKQLPLIADIEAKFDASAVTINGHCDHQAELDDALKALTPWRKGPFKIAETYIDTEWRSDFKWDRVLPHLEPLAGKRVLDIGCGNGYHCWRMLAQNPRLVVGVEPSVLFNLQFKAVQSYINHSAIELLPIGVEALPEDMNWFDTVFSMGVLYHRKSPIEHLYQLKSLLRPGGQLCLETLIINGGEGQVLIPSDRYARMRNVWFIPSAIELARWLTRCGFVNVRIADKTMTTIDEQRTTEWMPFESLMDCLKEDNHAFTAEGLPAPKRAVLTAERPS